MMAAIDSRFGRERDALDGLSDEFPECFYRGDYIQEIADNMKFKDMPPMVQSRLMAQSRFMKSYNLTKNQFVNGCRSGMIKFKRLDESVIWETMFGTDYD